MWIIRYIFYFFVAWGCAVTFFDSSILAVIIMVCMLEFTRRKSFDVVNSKEQKNNYNMFSIVACLVIGAGLIAVGKLLLGNDYIVILGAASLSVGVVMGIDKLLIPYIQRIGEHTKHEKN